MRNLIITLSLLLFITTSCSSDDSDDACTPIECLNGGIETVDCGCDCPEGYSGTDCSTQITPSSITILRVNVKKFPDRKPNGDRWDTGLFGIGGSDADLQLDILNANGNVIYISEALVDRASSGNCDDTNYFFPAVQLSGEQISSQLTFALYDEDPNDWEFMGGWQIGGLYSSNNGFPDTITIGECSDNIVFEVELDYSW